MKIDMFNHIFPKAFFDRHIAAGRGGRDIGKRVSNIQTLVDVDARLRVLDEFGEYVQVISLPLPPLEIIAPPDKSPQLAREANDGLAELVARHDRFLGFVAALPMNNPGAAAEELSRAVDELGAFGVQVYTNVAGRPLDAPEFQEVFEEAARRDVPIWMHPARGADVPDYQTETKSLYEIWWTFGWPYETSAAMARLVFSGYLTKFPTLKVITHHMGGMIPYFEGRVGHGWDQLGTRTSDKDYKALLASMEKRPVEYFKQFYADTALFGAASATRCGLDFFGLDRIVFASDMPFEPTPGMYARETIACVEALDLTPDQRDTIYRRNAEKLLNLTAASTPHS
jgi:predicted TIM-barrel fold metal-dependent hydrolase